MKRRTQNILFHLLPVVFWLLAAGGTLIPVILSRSTFNVQLSTNYLWGYLVAALALIGIWIISRIHRHTSSVEQCFQVAVLLGIASYWLPTVVFLVIPMWGYLYYKLLLDLRSVMATFVGLAFVAIWAAILVWLGYIDNPWLDFFAPKNAWGWIPAGALLLAWLTSTIARQILRVR